MCMLTFFPEYVLPDDEALTNGAAINADGHGFAIVTGRSLVIERDMNGERLIERFTAARRVHPSGPALFHSRTATAGSTGVANCHPFRVGGDAGTILAHNGILPSSVQPARRDKRSDTRIAAEDFLSNEPFGRLSTARARTRMERWLTDSNKVVILTVNPHYRRQAYVLNEHAGIWDSGIWYSNDDYRRPLHGYGQWDNEVCLVCDTYPESDNVDRVCQTCGTCLDCYESADNCVCDLSAGVRHKIGFGSVEWDAVAHRVLRPTAETMEESGDHTEPIAV